MREREFSFHSYFGIKKCSLLPRCSLWPKIKALQIPKVLGTLGAPWGTRTLNLVIKSHNKCIMQCYAMFWKAWYCEILLLENWVILGMIWWYYKKPIPNLSPSFFPYTGAYHKTLFGTLGMPTVAGMWSWERKLARPRLPPCRWSLPGKASSSCSLISLIHPAKVALLIPSFLAVYLAPCPFFQAPFFTTSILSSLSYNHDTNLELL